MDEGNSLEFQATLAQMASAIKVHGDGSGGRIQFDIPEVDKAALSWVLLSCPGRVLKLRVTVENEIEAAK